ncbi:MAG: substrate-binding domain-containing protein [Candidatus Cybelea sp.]|jgi:ABC-type phosphate transport system substrate-binding protein
MRNSLVAMTVATIPIVIFSACNGSFSGGAGVAPLPNAPAAASRGHVRPSDTGPKDLHAGGADFPGYAYSLGDQPVGTYQDVQPTPGPGSVFALAGTKGIVYYCNNSSGYGRKEFEANNGTATTACAPYGQTATGFGGRQDPLDFVGTDVALPSTECCVSGTPYYQGRLTGSKTWGQPFELPTLGGPIVFPYNASSFSGIGSGASLQLSTWSYCAISNGTISDWNDPAITADNGGKSVTGGNSETVDFYFRSDSSGATDLFTNKLNTSCNVTWKGKYAKAPYQGGTRNAAWTFGVNMLWPGPGSSSDPNPRFFGENGDPGILSGIQTDSWGTGYAVGAWAKAAGIAQASLLDTSNAVFVSPTNQTAVANALKNAKTITFGEGSDGVSLGSSTPWCQLYINPSEFVKPPAKAYPIVGITYWLFYGKNNGVHLADKKKLIKYITSTAPNGYLPALEYTPFTSSVHAAVRKALGGTATQATCVK